MNASEQTSTCLSNLLYFFFDDMFSFSIVSESELMDVGVVVC